MILSVFTEETEARRKVLRGRGTVTRRYYRGLAIPAWAIIVICGLGYLLIGCILYLVMRKFVLSSSDEADNSYSPAFIPVATNDDV